MRASGQRSPAAVAAAAAVFVAAMIVVVLAVAVGPAEVVAPGWLSEATLEPPDAAPLPEPTAEPLPSASPEELADDLPNLDVPWQAALVVALVAAAVLAYYLVRRLPALTSSQARAPVTGGHVEGLADVAEELRDAARAAGAALAGGPSGAAAVIEAWLALESAAAGSGAPRDPAQTPSEFTAALLRRHHADDTAIATLLGLYHRARFAARPDISEGDVDTARQALRTILDTLGTPAATGPS